MNGLSVIIPSKNAANFKACVHAVRSCEPDIQIIGIDGSSKDFVFAGAINEGIAAAGEDDVIALNDDALLETCGGFTAMQREADEHPEIGIIGCTTNVTGAPCQWRQNVGLRIVDNFAFVGVLIPRRTIHTVGLLDERFGGMRDGRVVYGWDDSDYIHRVKLAGLKCAVYDFCFLDHGSLQSTFRTGNGAGDIEPGRQIFVDKWGTATP